MTKTIEPFFVVWNPAHGLPRYKHGTFDGAKTEAERMANAHPGDEFFVLAVAGRAVRQNPVEWTPVDDIPF
ncbi:MAG: hypothetical protein GX567_19765 [Clostridia bacterium]|nr:hypothetical protein [Clostridia bacterium]